MGEPHQHSAQEWLDVVARMRRNMAAMSKTQSDEATLKEISDFLQRHGGKQK